jgi:ABC transporter DrrB family efflux protein
VTALRYGISDTLVLAKRSLLRIPRQPDLLVGFTIQPILFVLLFVYVFGGAIQTPGFDYVDFLMPGIIVQSIAFGGFVTALGLSDDLKKGLMDRFRSLPMTRSALLTGRTLGDVVTNVFQLVVMFTVGLLVGFNFSSSPGEVVAGIALLLLIGYAFSWVFAFIGLSASSPEASNAYGFTILFPLTFVSSAFVPVESMPGWLQPIAEHNPFTTMVDAARALFLGTPAGTTSGWRWSGRSRSSPSLLRSRPGATGASSPGRASGAARQQAAGAPGSFACSTAGGRPFSTRYLKAASVRGPMRLS